MSALVWLIPALPLAGFVALVVGGRRLGDPWAGWLATAAVVGFLWKARPEALARFARWIWPACLVLIGALLLLYREA